MHIARSESVEGKYGRGTTGSPEWLHVHEHIDPSCSLPTCRDVVILPYYLLSPTFALALGTMPEWPAYIQIGKLI